LFICSWSRSDKNLLRDGLNIQKRK
jgi:hypothetical protein